MSSIQIAQKLREAALVAPITVNHPLVRAYDKALLREGK